MLDWLFPAPFVFKILFQLGRHKTEGHKQLMPNTSIRSSCTASHKNAVIAEFGDPFGKTQVVNTQVVAITMRETPAKDKSGPVAPEFVLKPALIVLIGFASYPKI